MHLWPLFPVLVHFKSKWIWVTYLVLMYIVLTLATSTQLCDKTALRQRRIHFLHSLKHNRLCVHITPSTYKWTYLLYIYAFLCIILYTCLKVCPVGSSNILLNNPVNVYFLLCFKYLLMFLNSYKLDFFFSFAKHTHLQSYLALTLTMECQLWSILARLVIHKFFLLFCTSVSAPIYFISEKEV